jgi:L-lactate utilization protein LutB
MDQKSIEKTITNLKKNNFEVHYFEKGTEACEKIMDDLKDAKSISRAGSVTINSLGIIDHIKEDELPFRDYASPEDRKASVSAEYYLTGTNAVTEDGKLVNIDGAGNRVAAMSYGPSHIMVVAGTNKIVKDVDEGIKRIHEIAAPINAKRLERNTPCVKTGKCSDCNSDDRICRKVSIILKPVKGRYTIYLINEDLGF